MKSIKIIGILMLTFGITPKVFSQDDYYYKDKYDNQFKVCDWRSLPKSIDTNFLKQNLTGLQLNKQLLETPTRYTFLITITTIKANKKYKIELVAYPIDGSIETIISSLQGNQVYFMNTKIIDGHFKIDEIYFDHSEI